MQAEPTTAAAPPCSPREADNAIQAIVSAIEDVTAAGRTATGVIEDRGTVDGIAERAS